MSTTKLPQLGRTGAARPLQKERAALAARIRTAPLMEKARILEEFSLLYSPYQGTSTWVWSDFETDGSLDAVLDLLEAEDPEIYRRGLRISIEFLTFSMEAFINPDRKSVLTMRRRLPNVYRRLWTYIQTLPVSAVGVLSPAMRRCIAFTISNSRKMMFDDRDSWAETMALAHTGNILAYCLLIPYSVTDEGISGSFINMTVRVLGNVVMEWVKSKTAQAINPSCLVECSALLKQAADKLIVERLIQIAEAMDVGDSPGFAYIIEDSCPATPSQRLALGKSKFWAALYTRYWEWCASPEAIEQKPQRDREAQDSILFEIEYIVANVLHDYPKEWPYVAAPLASNTDTMYLLAKVLVRTTTQAPDRGLDSTPYSFTVERCGKIVDLVYSICTSPKCPWSLDTAKLRAQLEPIWLDTLQVLQDIPDTNKRRPESLKIWRRLATVTGIDEAAVLKAVLAANTRLQNGQAGCANHKCPLYGVETVDRMFVCVGCKKAFYCSSFCQDMDWDLHGPSCSQAK